MSIRHSALIGAAIVMSCVSQAGAADLGSMKDYGGIKGAGYAPAIATQPSWYVRIDGAYATHDDPKLVEDGIDTLTGSEIDDAWSFGGGVGRDFTAKIRGDITYERRFEADVEGSLDHPGATLPGTRRFGLESDLFLANLYYDFDAHGRFKPYIGAGLGFVRHQTTDGVVDSCGCTTGVVEGAEEWSVAAALMAGVDMKVRDRLHFDVGYRFLYLGHATTGPVTATTVGGGLGGADVVEVSDDPEIEEIHAHEIRFGLRYDIR